MSKELSGRGKPNPLIDKRPLTTLQMNFIEAYFEADQNMRETAKKLNLRTPNHGYNILKSPRVEFEIAKRKKSLQEYYLANSKFEISKEAKMNLLWEIALKGAEEKTLKTGAVVMIDPMSSIKSIQQLNLMMGHIAPAKLEVAEKKNTRTVAELVVDAKRLLSEIGV